MTEKWWNKFKIEATAAGTGTRIWLNDVELTDVMKIAFNVSTDKITTVYVELAGTVEVEGDVDRDGLKIDTAPSVAGWLEYKKGFARGRQHERDVAAGKYQASGMVVDDKDAGPERVTPDEMTRIERDVEAGKYGT